MREREGFGDAQVRRRQGAFLITGRVAAEEHREALCGPVVFSDGECKEAPIQFTARPFARTVPECNVTILLVAWSGGAKPRLGRFALTVSAT